MQSRGGEIVAPRPTGRGREESARVTLTYPVSPSLPVYDGLGYAIEYLHCHHSPIKPYFCATFLMDFPCHSILEQ
jgi:hypothetical protein